jgi:hypothetical protein
MAGTPLARYVNQTGSAVVFSRVEMKRETGSIPVPHARIHLHP